MPTKRGRPVRTDKRLALNKRLVQIRAEVAKLKHDRATVNRAEFVEMSKSLRQLQKNTDDLATQLMRIGQIQQEVDAIKRILVKAKLWDLPRLREITEPPNDCRADGQAPRLRHETQTDHSRDYAAC